MNTPLAVLAFAAVVLTLLPSGARGACPDWITATPEQKARLVEVIRPGGPADDECWCPRVTFHHNSARTHGSPVANVTRVEWLCNRGQMFPTRQQAEDYISSGAILGLWEADPLECDPSEAKCRWVPKEAFDDIGLVQIVHGANVVPEGAPAQR